MRGREYIVFLVAVAAVLLAAGWIAGSGDTVSAQSGAVRDCHFTLFGDRYMSTSSVVRPDVFLLDVCTGDTWLFYRDGLEWVSVDR